MNDQGYNRWTNQATWALNLDLNNTEALYYKYMNIAEQGAEQGLE